MEYLQNVLDLGIGALWDYVWGMIELACRFLLYPFFAVALYKLSVRENLEKPILSIIPIYNMTYIVKIIKHLHVFSKKINSTALTVLLILCVLLRNPIIGNIPLIGDFVSGNISVVFFFFYILALHRLWEMYVPKSADSFLILATLFPIIIPFLMFFIRNKQQISSQMLLDYNSDGIIDEVVTLHSTIQNVERNSLPNRTVLKQELATMWLKDCPIILNKQEIVSFGNEEIFLELTLQNLADNTIKAIYMDIICLDYLQNMLQGISDFKLIDLSVENNQLYSTHMNILLPDTNTRKCKLIIKNIVFENDELWNNKSNISLESTIMSEKIQFKPELYRFMSSKLKGREIPYNKYQFIPVSTEEYWICSCGQFNSSKYDACRYCHISKNEIFEIINEEKLQQDYTLMMQDKIQRNLEAKEQRQKIISEQKQQISNQISKGKDKLENLWKKK